MELSSFREHVQSVVGMGEFVRPFICQGNPYECRAFIVGINPASNVPFWPFWENVRSWWQIRNLPNVLLVHFSNLKRDMPGEIRRIASFLDIPINESSWPSVLEHCSFEWMKKNATRSVPLGGAFWDAGAEVFIHKGVNGRWAESLTVDEAVEYEKLAEAELGTECACWLATGDCM